MSGHVVASPPLPELCVLAHRILSEFHEMPGLLLTEAQAQRLWRLDSDTCRQVLTHLVTERYLRRTEQGRYLKA